MTMLLSRVVFRLPESVVKVFEAARCHRYWCVGFSGGKDSSVVVDLVLRYLLSYHKEHEYPDRVIVVYADTLLDPPPLRRYALSVIDSVNELSKEYGLPVEAVVVKPSETLVEMVLVRGYPAPSSRFRWCTDRWKIRPTREALCKLIGQWLDGELAVIAGVRGDEAAHRAKRRLSKDYWIIRRDDIGGTSYAPLQDWSVSDVWSWMEKHEPVWREPSWSQLRRLYSGKNLRIGCWVCTLISREKSWRELAERGLVDKQAYNKLMQWKQLYLRMSREEPERWRQKKEVCSSRWRYCYGKLKHEARRILAEKLVEIYEQCEGAREILEPLIRRYSNCVVPKGL